MVAQAVLEKGILESATLGVSQFVANVGDLVQAKPYVMVLAAVVVIFLLRRRR